MNNNQEKAIQEIKLDIDKTIKHIVLSGGVIYGFSFYGCLKHLIQENVLDMKKVESIYCTSVGSIVATVVMLNLELHIIDNYLIKRPWHNVFHISIEKLMTSYQLRGIFGKEFIYNVLDPLFRANDLNISTMTLQDFYEYTHIDMHIFVVKLPQFEMVDLNHIDYPNWLLLDAIYASACIPPLFYPLVENVESSEAMYIDGGFLMNYPLLPCMKQYPEGIVLGINLTDNNTENKIDSKMNLFEYIFLLIYLILKHLRLFVAMSYTSPDNNRIKEVHIPASMGVSLDVFKVMNSMDERNHFIQYGEECAKLFVQTHQQEFNLKSS
jgi:predicted acylesterase/phospholipase RssA